VKSCDVLCYSKVGHIDCSKKTRSSSMFVFLCRVLDPIRFNVCVMFTLFYYVFGRFDKIICHRPKLI
jgi:hypothetical protein